MLGKRLSSILYFSFPGCFIDILLSSQANLRVRSQRTATMSVSDIFDEFNAAVVAGRTDNEEHDRTKIDLAYSKFKAAASADTSKDWANEIFMADLMVEALKEPETAAEEEKEDEGLKKLLGSLKEIEDSVKSVVALGQRYDRVGSFAAETVGQQDPEQFDWNYFDQHLGDFESTFVQSFNEFKEPTRGKFARYMYDTHQKKRAKEADGSLPRGTTGTTTQ